VVNLWLHRQEVAIFCLCELSGRPLVSSAAGSQEEIRLICDELLFTHEQFIAARYKFREFLGVLKGSESAEPGMCSLGEKADAMAGDSSPGVSPSRRP
jgi:hypothetical protein